MIVDGEDQLNITKKIIEDHNLSLPLFLSPKKILEVIELIKLTDNKEYKSWKAYEFLSTAIPHYEDFIKKVYEDFEKMYKENVKAFSK